jgi:hypothetical protein
VPHAYAQQEISQRIRDSSAKNGKKVTVKSLAVALTIAFQVI